MKQSSGRHGTAGKPATSQGRFDEAGVVVTMLPDAVRRARCHPRLGGRDRGRALTPGAVVLE